MYGCTAALIRMWSPADISNAVTKYGGSIAYRSPSRSTQTLPGGVARARIERHDRHVVLDAMQPLEQPVGMILDVILLARVVGHALLPRVEPAERRLDAIGGVVRERQRDRPGRRNREQMAVAQTMLANRRLDALSGRRDANRGGARYSSASSSGNGPFSLANSIDARYAASRISRAIAAAICRPSSVS